MRVGTRRPSRVVELERRTETAGSEELKARASPMFGVAMLKIAMELKKAEARPLDELITGVLDTMKLDETEFRAYLQANGGLLKSIAARRRY